MFRSFSAWLNSYLEESGAPGLLRGSLGLFAFGGVLSALIGVGAIRAATLVVALLANLAALTILLATSRHLRRELYINSKAVFRYYEELYQAFPLNILSFSDTVNICDNGDVTGIIIIEGVVNSEKLLFFRYSMGPGWNQPVRMRKRVKVLVRKIESDGSDGARWDTTQRWREDGRLEVLAHFEPYAHKGDVIRAKYEYSWPAKCRPLMVEKTPDDFCSTFRNRLEKCDYTIYLPTNCQVYASGLDLNGFSHEICSTVEPSGQTKVQLHATGIPARHRFGIRLEVK